MSSDTIEVDTIPETTQNIGVSIPLPNTSPSTEKTPIEFANIIPEGFNDKPWVKDVVDIPGLFKMTDDLKSKLGERPAGIPHENSTPEEKASFDKSFGVPGKAEDFKLSEPIKGHEDFQNKVKDLFHKARISQNQAGVLDQGWNELMQQLAPDSESQNADFDKMAVELFGDKKETILSNANVLLESHTKDLPEAIRGAFNNLPNNVLVPLAAVLNSIQLKYINEDDIPSGGTVSPGLSNEEKRAKGRILMASDAYKDKFHQDHIRTAEEVKLIYGT